MSLYNSSVYWEDLHHAVKMSVNIEKLMGQSILVTGATGTIGSFIVDMLMDYNRSANADIRVYAAGRNIEKLEKRFSDIRNEKLIFAEYDMLKPIDFKFAVGYIIHAAGNAYPAAFNGNPTGTIIGNVSGTYTLLEYAKNTAAKRLLYVSSGEIYGQGDIRLESFSENYCGYLDVTSPRSCYPMSKRMTENLCVSYYKQFNLETVIVRPCHTYGPEITENDNRANVQFMRNVMNNEDIVLKSDGSQMRSYCYIADCASAILTVLLNGKAGQAYNSANRDSRITIAGLAKEIAKASGKKVIFAAPDMTDLANRTPVQKQVLNSEKIELLGWKGDFDIVKGISHTLDILREEGSMK